MPSIGDIKCGIWENRTAASRAAGHRDGKLLSNTAIIDGLIHRKFVGVADNLGHRTFRFKDLMPKELYAGVAHFLIFVGCFVLLIGTAMDVISHYGYDFILGNVYLGHSIVLDIGGVMVIIGVIMAVVRRYGQKPERLDNQDRRHDGAAGDFRDCGHRFCYSRPCALAYSNPPWAWWSPAG